jgi:branched-subunit amino acid ABC-type transport system permease component
MGAPAAALGAWGLADYGEVASVLIVPIAFAGAYAWGFIMWRLMFRDLYARKRALAEQTEAARLCERHNA